MSNLYAVTKRGQIHTVRNYEYAETRHEAVEQFKQYRNVTTGIFDCELVEENVERPFGGESCKAS